MLPTPHGPSDVPLPGGAGDAAVDTGRTPDEGALLRVVEHLADVPDGDGGDDATDAAAQGTEPQDAPQDAAAPAHDTPAAGDDDVTPAQDTTTPDDVTGTGDAVVPDEDAMTQNEEPQDVAADEDVADVPTDDDAPEQAPDADGSPEPDEALADEVPADPAEEAAEPAAEAATQDGDAPADSPVPTDEDASTEEAEPSDEAEPAEQAEPTEQAEATDDAGPASGADEPEQAPAATAPADEQPPAPAELPEPPVGPVAAALSDTRHRIDELNAAERIFLAQQRALVAELCEDPSDADAVSALFDRVHAQWVQAEDKPDLRPLADAFGIALGDLVCADAEDLGWATCSDRYGTEIVLAREDPEVLVYPIAAILQNWEVAGPGWFLRHLRTVVGGVVGEQATSA